MSDSGLTSLLFGWGLILVLWEVYGGGLMGWVVGAIFFAFGWILTAVYHWANPALFVVEGMTGTLMMGIALRWTLHHRAWEKRMTMDHRQFADQQVQVQKTVQDLKEKIAAKWGRAEHELKQYDILKKLGEAESWEQMEPILERLLKHFSGTKHWALYLANDHGELERVAQHGLPLELVPDDPSLQDPSIRSNGERFPVLGIPLWRLHERLGFLLTGLPATAASLQASWLEAAKTLSVQLIFPMTKAKLYREFDRHSRQDPLTGLCRRRPFEERLREEIARGQLFNSAFSLLCIQMDNFESLQKAYGTSVSQEILRTVAQRLRQNFYETDVLADFGGGTFVCLLLCSDPTGLKIKANRLCQCLGGETFLIGLDAVSLTARVGIAHFPHDGQTSETLIVAADRALARTQKDGPDRVMEAA